jgi:hypothetical protein
MGNKKPSKKGSTSKKKGGKEFGKEDAQSVYIGDTSATQQETEEPPSPAASAEPDVAEGQTSEAVLAGQETPTVEVEELGPKEPPERSPTSDEPTPTAIHTAPVRDPRLPDVGSVITRTFKGRVLSVKVLEVGFEYEGKTYPSISRLAKHITGHQAVNGYAFFKLGASAGGAGSTRQVARLAGKIRKLESLTVRMRAALAEAALALADAEAEVEKMKKETGEKGE